MLDQAPLSAHSVLLATSAMTSLLSPVLKDNSRSKAMPIATGVRLACPATQMGLSQIVKRATTRSSNRNNALSVLKTICVQPPGLLLSFARSTLSLLLALPNALSVRRNSTLFMEATVFLSSTDGTRSTSLTLYHGWPFSEDTQMVRKN